MPRTKVRTQVGCLLQVGGNSDLNEDWERGCYEKNLHSRYILKMKPTGFAYVKNERVVKDGIILKVFFYWKYWKNAVVIN